MTAENFAYWLQGYLELAPEGSLTKEQVEIIGKHLALVFENKTKDMKKVDWQKTLQGMKKETCEEDLKDYLGGHTNTTQVPGPAFGITTVSCSPYSGVKYC